jgi:hypothetical protein
MEVATDGVREGEVGCLFDEIHNLVEPTERLHTDVQAGPQRGRMPERRGRSRTFGPPLSSEGRVSRMPANAGIGMYRLGLGGAWIAERRGRTARTSEKNSECVCRYLEI